MDDANVLDLFDRLAARGLCRVVYTDDQGHVLGVTEEQANATVLGHLDPAQGVLVERV